MDNSFKKSFKHTLRNWAGNFKHLGRATQELTLFAVGITAPVTVFVAYPLLVLFDRSRSRK